MAKMHLRENPKFKKLRRRLQLPEAYIVGHLECMWQSAYHIATNAVHFRDIEEIEAAADWQGDEGFLANQLLELNFLDEVEGGFVVHDMSDHCPEFVAKRLQRSATVRTTADNGGQRQKMSANGPIGKKRKEKKRKEKGSQAKGSSESLTRSEPIIEFETVGDTKTFPVDQAKIDEWSGTYPTIDVLSELRKARQWITDNPQRRKTANGMPRFLNSWLDRATNSNSSRGRPPGMGKTVEDVQREADAAAMRVGIA